MASEPGTEPVESEDDIDSEWPGEYELYDSIEVLPSNAEVCFFLCLFFPFWHTEINFRLAPIQDNPWSGVGHFQKADNSQSQRHSRCLQNPIKQVCSYNHQEDAMLLSWWVQQPSLIVPDAAMPFKPDDCLIFIGLTGNLQKASPIMHWIYLTMKEWSPSEITLEVIMIASGRTVLDSTAMTEWLGKYESTSTTIQSVFKKQLDAAAGPWEQEKFEQFSCQLNCHYGSTILDGW